MMKAVLAMTVAVLASHVLADKVTPVQKVLQMMNDLKTKGLEEKQSETVLFTKFMQFCKDTNAEKEKAIQDAADLINKLKADIQQYDSDATTLGEEIVELDATIDQESKDKASATEQREVARADYEKVHAEYVANIEDLEVGISKLKSMASATSGASLIQQMAKKVRVPIARRTLNAFLESSSELELTAPEGAKFESQSGGIVEMMDDLKGKMEDERDVLEKEEMKAKMSSDMLLQTLADQIEQHTSVRNTKASTKKQKEANSALAQSDLSDTITGKGEDEHYVKDLRVNCETKSSQYEQRQILRSGEIKALNEAISIIAGGAVSGAAGKHLPSLAEESKSNLAQLRTSSTGASQSAAAAFLAAQGKHMNSRVLSMLAIRAKDDPFGKVKKMIADMIDKLMTEANEEAEHKGFCDTEMGTNKMTRDKKTTDVEELTADIEEKSARIQKLGDQAADLTMQVMELDQAVSEATELRQAEKTKNIETISDAEGAIAAVTRALGVLKDFYEGAAQATALVQVSQPDMSSMDKPFTGMGGEGGIVGMLEVILSDFERLKVNTHESETTNQSEFEKFSNESSQDKAVKQTNIRNKQDSKTELEVDVATSKKDLATTQEELDAANAYFDKLKPSCVEAGVSYEDRVARRKEEIESLNEALKILDESVIA